MEYYCTRNGQPPVKASKAILQGLTEAGGLFVPNNIPVLPLEELSTLLYKNYQEIATEIMGYYLTDYTVDEIKEAVQGAYGSQFDDEAIVPLHTLDSQRHILELWHGPTLAFKDIALQILPRLLVKGIKKQGEDKKVLILVATSGDTGKAALEGFKDVEGVEIIVLYPHNKVSEIQKLQMVTTEGNNTHVVAVEGNFDDCQSAAKRLFTDETYIKELGERGYVFSSANSINWGRLLPQIVYYFTSYGELVKKDQISVGDKVNFVVPTGNFGNILAAYYAKQMGLPINKLICASNENKVLTDFFNSGIYDKNREFIQTVTPSMDIIISSNLERFIYAMSGEKGECIAQWMNDLKETGKFDVGAEVKAKMDEVLAAGFATEAEIVEMIQKVYQKYDYVLDPHTAVGVQVYEEYTKNTGDTTVTIIDATASPYKFNGTVLQALQPDKAIEGIDEFALSDDLEALTGLQQPTSLKELKVAKVRHTEVSTVEALPNKIFDIIKK